MPGVQLGAGTRAHSRSLTPTLCPLEALTALQEAVTFPIRQALWCQVTGTLDSLETSHCLLGLDSSSRLWSKQRKKNNQKVNLFLIPFREALLVMERLSGWPEKKELGHCAPMLPPQIPPGGGSVPLYVGREVTGGLPDTAEGSP